MMDRQRNGLSLERQKRLAMDFKQIHTRIRNLLNELSRAYPNGKLGDPLLQLEKTLISFQEAATLLEESLLRELPSHMSDSRHYSAKGG
jgi:hypothetical protein